MTDQEMQDRIDELEAENRALKQEIRVCNGNMRQAIHNAEIAKQKAERARADYEKRLSEQPDEFWRREVRLANSSRDFWKREHDKMLKLVQDAMTLLRGKGKYTTVEAEEVRDD